MPGGYAAVGAFFSAGARETQGAEPAPVSPEGFRPVSGRCACGAGAGYFTPSSILANSAADGGIWSTISSTVSARSITTSLPAPIRPSL